MPVVASEVGFRWTMVAAVAMLTGLVATASAATYEVNTLDYVNATNCTPQQCSLHTAIAAANQNPGPDTIVFAIGSGRQVMQWIPGTPSLPFITDAVAIDGTSQPGFAGTPLIELEGFRIGIEANDCSVRSLSIHSSTNGAAVLIHGRNNVIQGNYLGLDGSGNLRGGNQGVSAYWQGPNVIGGGDLQDPLTRNLICGNQSGGIVISYSGYALIHGNYIGTDPTGRDLGNPGGGILAYASGVIIRGNVVAHNSSPNEPYGGINISGDQWWGFGGALISQNSVYDNEDLGIDLAFSDLGVTVTPNDPCDADYRPSNVQNFPVLDRATVRPGRVIIEGTLDSIAAKDYTLEFFANSACDASGHGEGERYLGSLPVSTDASCIISFTAGFAAAVAPGEAITATATDPDGNTSEFSACVAARHRRRR